jgi:hypothetical protein
MKYDKMITVNIGNFESIKIGVSDAPSFADCDKTIIEHLKHLGIAVDKNIHQALKWAER